MLRIRLALGLLLSILCAGAGWAGPPLSQDEAMKLLSQPNRWIDTDGALRPDGTYVAKEIQIAATSAITPTEDPAIYGAVEGLDRTKGMMKVLGYRVLYDGQTKLQDENKKVILSSRIQDGSNVKVQGKLLPNGAFQATKIRLQKMDKGKTRGKTKLYGPATVVDARAGTLKVLNTTVMLRPDAMITEDVAPGGN